jgi:hypothetical protein
LKADIFPYLVIGLAKFLEKPVRKYPYPDPLRYSLNHLSLALAPNYPKTTNGLIDLFSKPLSDWWPIELPAMFDPKEPLVEDNDLSFEAMSYLENLHEQDNAAFQGSLSQIDLVLDNHRFKQLIDRLREKSLSDPDRAQGDYVTFRKFIIEHPYALQREISAVFSETKYIHVTEVSDLYIKANDIADVLRYPDLDGRQVFWLCDHCGPLRVKNGQPESIKRSVCNNHCPRHQGGWKTINPTNQLNVLRKGIHLRTYLPGIPELALFNWLEESRQKHSELIQSVSLWPRIDMYDLQIKFADSTWAIDVKDHQEPDRLGRSLAGIYGEGDLQWDRGFYVYPDYRDKQRKDYGEALRLATTSRLHRIEIVNEERFKERVAGKLKSLKKGKH